MAKLNEMIKEFRLSVNQSVEGIALLLQLKPEEYEALEKDWIPPDDLLQRLCALFEWNYNDIKRIAGNNPSASSKMTHPKRESSSRPVPASNEGLSFSQMLQNARMSVGQNAEGMATLLGIPSEYYLTFEENRIPPDDLLRKICTLFEWNYLQIRRMIITHSTPRIVPRQPPIPLKEIQSKLPKPEKPIDINDTPSESLGERLYQARMDAGQSVDGVALLLRVNPEFYQQVEDGQLAPDAELLKRISSVFQWNYNEVLLLVYNENIRQFQPAIPNKQVHGGKNMEKLRTLQKEISDGWLQLSEKQQESLLTQLELVRDTMKRFTSNLSSG